MFFVVYLVNQLKPHDMITFEKFKELIGKFEESGMHPRLGYEITESQFRGNSNNVNKTYS